MTHLSANTTRRLPPPSWRRSPYSGWTRAHWQAQADLLLDAVRPFASASHALIALPGRHSASGPRSDALEGFARTFLLAAFRIAGARGQGREAENLVDRYANGLAAGANPRHPEAWLRITAGRPNQPMVEAASIALALHETRPWLWDQLDARTRDHVATWLGGFLGGTTVQNNWMLFQTIVEEFLASVGAPHHEHEILRGLEALEGWHLGGGWYTDGTGRRIDHYNGWALHFYPLLWTRIAATGPRADLAATRAATYRDRLRTFLADYIHLIGADGAPVHQGRSLTYRFAAATPLWTGALFDCSPLPPGQTRRAASAVLRHFTDHCAPDDRGLLRLGWHAEHLPTSQDYSGPASPYWASKGFLGLLLPPDHPVWQDTELPLPAEEADHIRALPAANWLIQSTSADGIVRLHNHGSDGLDPARPAIPDPHYARLAYSTATAPSTRQAAAIPDNQVTLISPRGELGAPGPIHPLGANCGEGIGHTASWHQPRCLVEDDLDLPIPHARIETHVLAFGSHEVRIHAVTAPRGWQLRASGYSLAAGIPAPLECDPDSARASRSDGMSSTITALHGFIGAGQHTSAEPDALGPKPTVPYLIGRHPGGTHIYASHVQLTGSHHEARQKTDVDVYVDPGRVEVLLPEGTKHTWTRLPAPDSHGAILRPDAVAPRTAFRTPTAPQRRDA
ncbi:DUF2264 domain-containing protein [Streptacidiphilus sp. MAP5-52]|uniref:DUF2264 domain-containing protein n=1 Tax=Streptacidiphilus sp. MAP5-52 TaxID=3156267 RepID=UPI0035117654